VRRKPLSGNAGWRIFSRCSEARSSAPLHLMGSLCVALLNFLDPRGPRAHISCYLVRFRLPRFPLHSCPPCPPDILHYTACAYSLQHRACAVNSYPTICFKYTSLFHYFLYFTNTFFSSFIASTITYPVSSNVTSPKALFPSPSVLNFRLFYCLTSLCSDTQRLHSILYFTGSTKVSFCI